MKLLKINTKLYHFACLMCHNSTNSNKLIKSCFNCGNNDKTRFFIDITYH